VDKLNEHSAPDEQYKVLYFGRHGEGYHNVAEAQYGREAWDVSIVLYVMYKVYRKLIVNLSVTGPNSKATVSSPGPMLG